MTTSAEVIDRLVAAPRQSAVLDVNDRIVLVRAEVPVGGRALGPHVLIFTKADGEWTPTSAVNAATAVCLGGDDVLLARTDAAGSRLSVRSTSGEESPLCEMPARVMAMAYDSARGVLACTARAVKTPGAGGPFEALDVVRFHGAGASVGASRRRAGDVEVWLVRMDSAETVAERLETRGETLTGDCAWSAGWLVLGMVRDLADGRRRFGLLLRRPDGVIETMMDDHIDLSAPVGRDDPFTVACLGTTVPDRADEHPRQLVVVIDERGKITQITDGNGLWEQPRAWAGTDTLVTTAEDGPRRRLFVRAVDGTARHDIVAGLSVLDVVCGSGRIAALTSAVDRPPHLVVTTSVDRTLEHAADESDLLICGTTRRVELPDPELATPLGAWLIEPPAGSATGTLTVIFHGGPLKSWTDWPWRWNPWPFVAAGSTVALVDPPMSLGYGNQAVTVGWRRWRAGIAAVAQRQVRRLQELTGGPARPLALMGGSFGGYLAMSVAEVLRPRLVVAHGAPVDLATIAAVSDVGWQWLREFGEPELNRELYEQSSIPPGALPARTRLLLSHGLHDDLVPVQESVRIHRRAVGDGVRSELVVFRDEGHPLLRPDNLRAWFHWVLRALSEEIAPS